MDEQFFNRIYTTYYADLYRFIFSYVRTKEKTEDMLQETFLKFYTEPPKKEEKVKCWLFSVSKNLCLNLLKKEKREAEYLQTVPQITKKEDKPYMDLMSKVDLLPSKYQEVIKLFYFANLTIKEIAKIQLVSEENVKKRLQRGREKLKEIIGDNYE